MNILQNAVGYVTSLPSTVFIGLVMAVICLVFGGGIKNSIRSGCLFAIGLTGVNLLMNNCVIYMQEIATLISERLGIELNIVDAGYGAVNGIWMFPGATIALIAIIGINILFIFLKWTKIMWTDIHNTWHGIYIGLLVYALTGNVLYGTIVAIVTLVIMMKLGDWCAPVFQEFNKTPGIAVYATSGTIPALFTWLVMKVINKIPGLRDLDATAENIQDRFGLFGETMVSGMMIGIILGIVAGYDFPNVMLTGVTLSATMALFPKMAALICEGIVPVTNSVMSFMKKHFADRDLYVGVDVAILLGDPSVMASFILMVPISVILSIVVPGIGFIPIASLAGMPYWLGGVVAYTKGNVVHTVISMTLFITLTGLCATALADVVTQAAYVTGQLTEAINAGVTITCWDEGGSFMGFLFVKLFELLGLGVM